MFRSAAFVVCALLGFGSAPAVAGQPDGRAGGREGGQLPATSCSPTTARLCLLAGRFVATVTWENQFNGEHGNGGAQALTDFSGLFYFTDPANPELMLKVIDFGDVVKVFYGQLTNLHFELTVTDTRTGSVKSYRNSSGECGAIDQAAFPSIGGRSDVLLYKGIDGNLQGTCSPSSTRLCLINKRFAVDVSWRNHYNGTAGAGQATRSSDLAGLFNYGDARNVELLTKALDFGDRILFIYGALSDLEYQIRVLDTVSGQVKEYTNPGGRFCGGLDDHAFEGGGGGGGGSDLTGIWQGTTTGVAHRGTCLADGTFVPVTVSARWTFDPQGAAGAYSGLQNIPIGNIFSCRFSVQVVGNRVAVTPVVNAGLALCTEQTRTCSSGRRIRMESDLTQPVLEGPVTGNSMTLEGTATWRVYDAGSGEFLGNYQFTARQVLSRR